MSNSFIGWLAFIVLVSVIGITSCQASVPFRPQAQIEAPE